MVLVRAMGADREDELRWQPVPGAGRRHGIRGDRGERPRVDAVGDQGGAGGGRVVRADVGQAGPGRRGGRGGPPEDGPGGHLQRGLAVPAAGEAHIVFDRAVVQGHHERARTDERRERRVRHVQRGRSGRPDDPGEFPAAVHRPGRDVRVDHLGVGGQPGQREDLLPAAVHQHPEGAPVRGPRHVPGQLHHRTGDPVRTGKGVHPRVDQDRTILSHVPAPLSIPLPSRPVRGSPAPRLTPPATPARELLCPHP